MLCNNKTNIGQINFIKIQINIVYLGGHIDICIK